jgi:hypothetical protein
LRTRTPAVALNGDIIEVVAPKKPGPHTPGGRFLLRNNIAHGGYMIIMQSADAVARRARIQADAARLRAKRIPADKLVIYEHVGPASACIQYHPKLIPGNVMPELDSHAAAPAVAAGVPSELTEAFAPWHAIDAPFEAYREVFRRSADLAIVGVQLRLPVGQRGTEDAAREWRDVFGVPMSRDLLAFTNARLGFLPGEQGKREGLETITIAVKGKKRFDQILEKVAAEGLCGDGWTNLLGVKWYFRYAGEPNEQAKI